MAHRDENEADAIHVAPQRPVPVPRPRKTIVDIQPFTGRDNEDITEWMINWDIAAVANGLTDENQIQLIPAYLSGRAARMFWRIPLEERQDLEQLKESLEDHFNTEEKKFLARQKLQEIAQGPKESVAEFSEKIDKLVIKGHDGLDSLERKDRIACEFFIKGLRPEIKETVWEKSPRSFQEAITAAERREVFLNSLGRKSRVNTISDDVMATIQKFNEERVKSNEEIWKAIQNLTKAVESLASQAANKAQLASQEPVVALQPSRYQGARRPPNGHVVYYRCNQPGHIQRNCPQAAPRRSQQQNTNRS
eukprot:gene9761-18282_t